MFLITMVSSIKQLMLKNVYLDTFSYVYNLQIITTVVIRSLLNGSKIRVQSKVIQNVAVWTTRLKIKSLAIINLELLFFFYYQLRLQLAS